MNVWVTLLNKRGNIFTGEGVRVRDRIRDRIKSRDRERVKLGLG